MTSFHLSPASSSPKTRLSSMITTNPLLCFFLLFFLPLITPHHSPTCDKSCSPEQPLHDFPYPVGFSSGCEIRLNCTDKGTPIIGDFPVQLVTSDIIKVAIEAECSRPFLKISQLFGTKFAPTGRNAFLMQNCSSSDLTCMLPETMVRTRFETPNCSLSNGNVICYSQNSSDGFMDFRSVSGTRCEFILSSISAESLNGTTGVSLEVQTAELGWWVEGNCRCSSHSNCTTLLSPTDGRPVYRCKCNHGYVGDGYSAGTGCKKDSSHCSPTRYISSHCGGTAKIIVLVGGIAGGALLMVAVGLIYCFVRRSFKSKARRIAKRRLSEATGACTIPIYAYKEIERATDFFSDKYRLGTGAYGTVYAAKLPRSDEWVAVKRLKNRDTDSIEQVMNEVKLLSSVNHPNLVRLLGCSVEKGEQILVYEFMPNGTLSQHLQREGGKGLPWETRLRIAIETAQAISHLHSATNPPIFHRDIKSSNILLDQNFKSKVADFGLSRLGLTESSHISTAPQGTPGYLDPQYHQNFHLSDKSDVYSFGVVLLEIITGLKVVDFSRPKDEVNLASLGTERIRNGRVEEIIDPILDQNREGWTTLSVQKVAELAFRCLAFDRDVRPSMTEVAAELEQIGLIQSRASSLVFSSSCSSNSSEKILSKKVDADDLRVSVQTPWLSSSEQIFPCSTGLLSNVIL